MDFKGSYEVLQNFFDLHFFHNETMAPLKFFEIFTEMHFVSLLVLNERKKHYNLTFEDIFEKCCCALC